MVDAEADGTVVRYEGVLTLVCRCRHSVPPPAARVTPTAHRPPLPGSRLRRPPTPRPPIPLPLSRLRRSPILRLSVRNVPALQASRSRCTSTWDLCTTKSSRLVIVGPPLGSERRDYTIWGQICHV
eukprot:175134-Chlamydomonas_euryale.AAC.2